MLLALDTHIFWVGRELGVEMEDESDESSLRTITSYEVRIIPRSYRWIRGRSVEE